MEYRLMGAGDDFAAIVSVDDHENMRTVAQANNVHIGQKIVEALNLWERTYG